MSDLSETIPSETVVCCLFCEEDAALIRISKKQLPFFFCVECRTRAFWNTATAVRGYFEALNLTKFAGEEHAEARARHTELKQLYGDFTSRSLAVRRGAVLDARRQREN